MLAKAFVIAMAADIARSDYAKPTLIRSRSREWLIACRWGPDGEYLSIATAGADHGTAAGFAPRCHCPDPQPVRRAGLGIGNGRRQHIPAGAAVAGADRTRRHLLSGRRLCAAAAARRHPPGLRDPLFAQLRLAGRQGSPQGHSRSGAVVGGGDGMAHRGQALRLDRRVHFRIECSAKGASFALAADPDLSSSEMPRGFQRECMSWAAIVRIFPPYENS